MLVVSVYVFSACCVSQNAISFPTDAHSALTRARCVPVFYTSGPSTNSRGSTTELSEPSAEGRWISADANAEPASTHPFAVTR